MSDQDFYAPHHPVKVLAAHGGGPMDVRALTRAAAKIYGDNQYYEHIDGSLRAAEERGEVRRAGESNDYRAQEWELVS